jgi:ATP-dependent RNA helicase DDX1
MSGGFEDLGLMPELVQATQDQGWLLPSDIQDEAIPLILGGGDVMAVRSLSGLGNAAVDATCECFTSQHS